MLRRPVEQPQGLGPRRGIELARPRPDLDPRFDRPEPQIPPHGVARDLELARDTFGAPSSPVQLADLANHLGVDHRHLRSRWCHARRLCRHVSSSLGPREEGSDLDSDGGHYCDRPTLRRRLSKVSTRSDRLRILSSSRVRFRESSPSAYASYNFRDSKQMKWCAEACEDERTASFRLDTNCRLSDLRGL